MGHLVHIGSPKWMEASKFGTIVLKELHYFDT